MECPASIPKSINTFIKSGSFKIYPNNYICISILVGIHGSKSKFPLFPDMNCVLSGGNTTNCN
jgi:hypothetical protein